MATKIASLLTALEAVGPGTKVPIREPLEAQVETVNAVKSGTKKGAEGQDVAWSFASLRLYDGEQGINLQVWNWPPDITAESLQGRVLRLQSRVKTTESGDVKHSGVAALIRTFNKRDGGSGREVKIDVHDHSLVEVLSDDGRNSLTLDRFILALDNAKASGVKDDGKVMPGDAGKPTTDETIALAKHCIREFSAVLRPTSDPAAAPCMEAVASLTATVLIAFTNGRIMLPVSENSGTDFDPGANDDEIPF